MLTALRDRKLQAYLAGNLLSISGTWAQRVVVFWMAWEMTGSTAVLGILAALDLAPGVIAAPFAGALADRRPARKLTFVVQFVAMLPPFVLAFFAIADQISLALLMTVTFSAGLIGGFDHPLRLLLVGNITKREQVSNAVALNSTSFNLGRMIGPALGGWLIAQDLSLLVFLFNAASFLVFALVLSRPYIVRDEDAPQSVVSGYGFRDWVSVFQRMDRIDRRLFLYFASLGLLLRPIFELLPSQAARFVSGALTDTQAYSLLTSTQGFGALFGALFTSFLLSRIGGKFVAVCAGLAASFAVVAFLFSQELFVALLALSIVSGAVLMNGISTQVMLQMHLPREMKGRALALYTMTLRGTPALGAFGAGVLGGFIPQSAFFIFASVVLLLWSGWLLILLRRLD